MTTSVNALLKRVNAMLAAIENRQQQQVSFGVVIYDPATKQILQGEPNSNGITFWIPDNGRGDLKGPYAA